MKKIPTGYSLNECPPVGESIPLSLQQIVVLVFNVLPVPLLIGSGVGLSAAEITILVAGCLLGGLGLYEPLVEFAGAGATVPLTGFGNNLAKGVLEGVWEDGFLGLFQGALTAASGGITAAVLLGFLAALVFEPKEK